MLAIMQRGRDTGATVSDISVFIGNDAAQEAYEKAGYVAIAEKRDPAFEAVYKSPGVRTLRRTRILSDASPGNRSVQRTPCCTSLAPTPARGGPCPEPAEKGRTPALSW
jgi:hypothetical protein